MATAVMGATGNDGMMMPKARKGNSGRATRGSAALKASPNVMAPTAAGATTVIQGAFTESQLLSAAAVAPPPPAASNMTLALDDLASRFILNCPAETARDEMMLLMFEVEKAFWFYLDFWREHDTSLPSLGMKDFCKKLFAHCAMLQPYVGQLETILTTWNGYKREVPTFGAVILDETLSKVLLVRGWNSKTWGWPKGKVNKDEDQIVCAAREVYEEIGFDCSSYLSTDRVISLKVGEVMMKLFVAAGVPETTYFETQTRKEISEIKWHNLKDLGKDTGPKLFSVTPVLGRLRGWVADYRRSMSRSKTPPKTLQQEVHVAPNGSPLRAPGGRKGKRGAEEGRKVPVAEMDAAGVTRNNVDTFGAAGSHGFSVEDMFRVNEEKFGIKSSYSFDQYTTKLGGSDEADGTAAKCMYAERYRPMVVNDDDAAAPGLTSDLSGLSTEAAATPASKSGSFDGFRLDAGAIMGSMSFC